ncbi:hypothetical protein Aduo_004314 [Ancylostoma duodenale]
MGIQNLLPFVKKACRQGNVSEFAGCSVAVDVSCLLHRGLFGCMESVAQGKKTTFYIHYVSKHIKALLDLGCHVVMVFDGRPLPAKKNTNDERRQRRAENVKAAELLLSEGKINEAVDKFKRATSITLEVVESTIEHFRTYKNVDVIVSPYESDAQLAFLVNEGLADVVVTEDSDLIAFGCEKIAFKWNCETGECTIYEKKELPRCFSGVMSSQFDFTKFRRICILSGCDYLQAGLPGIGLNKALSFFSKTSRTDLKTLLPRIPNYLNMSKLTVSKEFIDEFIRAENTFIHQVIFDPRQRCQRPLTPYPCPRKEDQKRSDENDDDDFIMPDESKQKSEFSYAGEVLSSNLAVRLALGNQIEKSVITDKFFLPSPVPEWSVWSDRFENCGKRKRRLEEERKREEKKCGSAFRFDSPLKKRVKLDTSAAIDFIDLEPEIDLNSASEPKEEEQKQSFEKACSQSKGVPNKRALENGTNPTTRPKSLKNQANCSWTVDEVMKMYGSQDSTSTPTTSTAAAATGIKSQPTIATAATITTVTASTGLGRSAYFVRRSASCANPFRKPVLKPASATPKSDAKEEVQEPTKAATAEEKEKDEPTAVAVTMIKPIGCRAPGLRASFSS